MSESRPRRRLAVLGSPIAHSKSPALHRAAYAALDLDWTYDALEVAEGGLAAFLAGRDASWRGLSLTMPLKREVLPLLTTRTPLVDAVGAANTVLLRDGRAEGFNTDVTGIVAAFREAGIDSLDSVQVLGAGATAASVLAAVSRLGASRVLIGARDPQRARSLEPVAAAAGLELAIQPLGDTQPAAIPDAVVSTLPGGAGIDVSIPDVVRRKAVLFDVAYEPWPTPLALSWQEAGGAVIGGLSLLLHQAVAQVRIFVTGDEHGGLEDETRAVSAMRAAVGL